MTTTNTGAGASAREGFEAQRRAGINVDWFTWQIAWHDALFKLQDCASPTPQADAAPLPREAATVWQPIETAPKTGRTLLLGYLNSAGKWRTVRGQWMSEAYISEQWEEPDDAEPGWYETSVEADDPPNCWPIEPTHWMPLPAAPAESTGAPK